jgi:hypothetical protein
MTKYLVVGEYGPVSGMSIDLEIEAATEHEAFEIFCEKMKEDYFFHWEKMGRRNVSVLHEVKEVKAEPVVPKSVWEVKFVGRMTPYKVHALTFLEAVEEAKKVALEIGEAETNIKAVTYLMY